MTIILYYFLQKSSTNLFISQANVLLLFESLATLRYISFNLMSSSNGISHLFDFFNSEISSLIGCIMVAGSENLFKIESFRSLKLYLSALSEYSVKLLSLMSLSCSAFLKLIYVSLLSSFF